MTITLYEQNQPAWDALAAKGFPNLREMAKHFTMCADMDRSLGYDNVVSKWQNRGGMPSASSEKMAAVWLRQRQQIQATTTHHEQTASNLMLVTCGQTPAEKVRRVLALLGCEVVEV